MYGTEVHQKKIVLDGNMREAVLNPGPTKPPISEPGFTTDVRNLGLLYRKVKP